MTGLLRMFALLCGNSARIPDTGAVGVHRNVRAQNGKVVTPHPRSQSWHPHLCCCKPSSCGSVEPNALSVFFLSIDDSLTGEAKTRAVAN